MKKSAVFFLFVALTALESTAAFAANSCGDTNNVCTYDTAISANETWIDGNTYVLLTDVNVSGTDVVLTIQPGAVVKYLSGTDLSASANGKITANGTADKNILFLSCKDQNTYAGSTNANTSTIPGCSGAPAVNDYNTALWFQAGSGMTASDSVSYIQIRDANNGIVLDINIGSIHDNNFSDFNGSNRGSIILNSTTAVQIYNNTFTNFATQAVGIFNTNGAYFEGSVHHNYFTTFSSGAIAIRNATISQAAHFDANVYSNIFTNFNASRGLLQWATASDWNGNVYNNLFVNHPANTAMIYINAGNVYGAIYNNTIANNFNGSGFVKISGTLNSIIQNNLFVNTTTPISTTATTATVRNNAYLNVGDTKTGPNDLNSATGFTADPFLGDNSDRNFLLNTNANGGALLANAGFGSVDSYLQLRTTQANNSLDRGIADIGYHYDQNTPNVTVVSPSDSNTLTGIQTIDFNIESAFGTAAGLTGRLAYSTTNSGNGTQIASQTLSSYSCSAGPYFVCTHPFDTTTIPDGNYFIALTATDTNGSMTDYSNNNFQINNSNPTPEGTGSPITCGNNLCQTGETPATCPADCSAICGDYACTNTENSLTCPIDCKEGCGNNICEITETATDCPIDCKNQTETILEETDLPTIQQSPKNSEKIRKLLDSIGISNTNETDLALKTVRVKRTFIVQTIQNETELTKRTKILLTLSNQTAARIKNIQVLEAIPKQFLNQNKNIQSPFPFQRNDETNQFSLIVPGLEPNQTTTIEYYLSTELSTSDTQLFQDPLVISISPATTDDIHNLTCTNHAECEDNNPCTANRCIQGTCYSLPLAEGETCDIGSVCQNSHCVRVIQLYTASMPIDTPLLATAALILIAILAIGYEYIKK